MPWGPLNTPVIDLLTMYGRIERLRVVEKIKIAELHFQAAGLDTTPLVEMRRSILAQPIGDKKLRLPYSVVKPPPDRNRPLKNLSVEDRGHG